MFHRLIRWQLRVLPPLNILLGSALMILLIGGVPPLFLIAIGERIEFPLGNVAALGAVGGFAVAYGIFRVAGFHPIFQNDYLEWLEQTPWEANLPLPLGPIRLVPQDLLPVALLLGLSLLFEHGNWVIVPTCFGAAYVIAAMVALSLTSNLKHAYALSWGLGGVLYLYEHPIFPAILLLGSYIVVEHGIRKSLKEFRDWNAEWIRTQTVLQTNADVVRSKINGWPFDRLAPATETINLSKSSALAIVALGAWWCFVLMSVASEEQRMVIAFGTGGLGNLLTGIRLVNYVWGYAPPISLWGRIRTGRWIIPGYDIVFVAPAMILLMGGVGAFAIIKLGFDPLYTLPAVVAAQLYAAMMFPPSVDEWRLTGNHRIVPAIGSQANELQQTQ